MLRDLVSDPHSKEGPGSCCPLFGSCLAMSQGELRDKLVIEAEQLTIFPNLQVKKMEMADAKWLTADYCEGSEKPGLASSLVPVAASVHWRFALRFICMNRMHSTTKRLLCLLGPGL